MAWCEHGLDGRSSGTGPEGLIQYEKEGHMGGELTPPWTWQQDMVLREQEWGLRRDESLGNRSL